MFSALVITRTFLIALPEVKRSDGNLLSRLFNSGLNFGRKTSTTDKTNS